MKAVVETTYERLVEALSLRWPACGVADVEEDRRRFLKLCTRAHRHAFLSPHGRQYFDHLRTSSRSIMLASNCGHGRFLINWCEVLLGGAGKKSARLLVIARGERLVIAQIDVNLGDFLSLIKRGHVNDLGEHSERLVAARRIGVLESGVLHL